MRSNRLLVSIPLALALAAAASPAGAQRVSSPYRFVDHTQDLGPFVGWMATDRGSARLGPKGGLLYGIEYSIRVSAPLSVGVFGSYFPTERDVIDPSTEGENAAVVGVEQMDLLLLAARLKLNITGSRTWHNLTPHLFLGLGLAIETTADTGCAPSSTRPDCRIFARERFDFGNSFMAQFGLGTIWLPTGRVGARLTVHDNIWRLDTPDGFFDPEVALDPVPPESDWTNNIQVTIALTYWF